MLVLVLLIGPETEPVLKAVQGAFDGIGRSTFSSLVIVVVAVAIAIGRRRKRCCVRCRLTRSAY